MTCPEIHENTGLVYPVLPVDQRFPPRIQRQLNAQFNEVWKLRERPPADHDLALIRLWPLLQIQTENAYPDQHPPTLTAALILDTEISALHAAVMTNPKSLMRMYTNRLEQLLPVYSIASLRRQQIPEATNILRSEVTAAYQSRSEGDCHPACWWRHLVAGTLPGLDWEHFIVTLEVIYRNSLQPGSHTEKDPRIVSAGFMALLYFFKEAHIYEEEHDLKPQLFERTEVLSAPILPEGE